MTDRDPDADATDRSADAHPEAEAPPPRRRRRRWKLWLLLTFVVAPVTLFALWTVFALNWSYSSGWRSGYVQKISKKGVVCKTWEGELAQVNYPGAMQQQWNFSVRNDSIAHEIEKSMGKQVTLTYDQHIGVPTACFGETQYFITAVGPVK